MKQIINFFLVQIFLNHCPPPHIFNAIDNPITFSKLVISMSHKEVCKLKQICIRLFKTNDIA